MAIRVSCQSCGRAFESDDSQAGKRGKCPNCGTPIQVPNDAPQARIKKSWYAMADTGEQYGPASETVLNEWVAEGRLTAECQVRMDGDSTWRRVGDLFPHVPADEHKAGSSGEFDIAAPSATQVAVARSRGTGMRRGGLGDIFDVGFHKFITPLIVKIIYVVYLVILALVLALVLYFLYDNPLQPEYVAMVILLTAFVSFLGLLFIRIALESAMVLFRMEEHLGEIRNHG